MINQAIGRMKTATKAMIRTEFDCLDLLRSDHMKVEGMLVQLRLSQDATHREKLFRTVKSELAKHMALEEEIFYPACENSSKLRPLVEHAYDEHEELRGILRALTELGVSSRLFNTKLNSFVKTILHHVKDEENELFPQVREQMEKREFLRMNRTMIVAHSAPRSLAAARLEKQMSVVAKAGKSTGSRKTRPVSKRAA